MNILLIIVTLALLIVLIVFWYRERKLKQEQYEFFTIVTHKFRTPLTGIKWALQALQGDVTQQQKIDILKQMQISQERLMEIVDLMTSFVKLNTKLDYAFEAASLQEMVQESLEKISQRIHLKNIQFTLNTQPGIPLVVIDKRKIQFVVDMLIDNAVKYTPATGSIIITMASTKKSLVLAIKDSGIGFTSQEKSLMFRRFYRTPDAKVIDTEGMGLGLYTARTIAQHHGGTLYAQSEGKNKGATFFLELPFSSQ